MTCQHDNFMCEDQNCISLVPIFNFLSNEEMAEIQKIVKKKTYVKGEMIFLAGEENNNLYVVHQGLVKITKYSNDGKEQVLRILRPGDFLGEHNLFSNKSLDINAQAVHNSKLCVIEGNKLKELILKYPEIAFKILEEISYRLAKAEELLKNIAIESAEKRVIDLLISLCDENNVVTLDMKKKDIASMLGMSAETLSRTLSNLEKNNIIRQSKNKIIILDENYLFS